ncbi:MAG: M56 family metallopeptidase, partial [Candidatus Hydrogenedentes bacterium]|nr:M56 family metallopeptidase [Candidatus Hydrogenedentota bacterium]
MPRIAVTGEAVSPFTYGVMRPVVVLPAAFLQTVDEGGLLAVLAHEFVHLRRRDLPLGVLLALCEILYFFHPVFHAVRRMVLRERERACDEAVIATSSQKPSTYARALVGAAELCRSLQCARPSASLATESFSDLRIRLLAMTADLRPAPGLSRRGLLLIVALGVLCVPGISLTVREAESAAAARGIRGTDVVNPETPSAARSGRETGTAQPEIPPAAPGGPGVASGAGGPGAAERANQCSTSRRAGRSVLSACYPPAHTIWTTPSGGTSAMTRTGSTSRRHAETWRCRTESGFGWILPVLLRTICRFSPVSAPMPSICCRWLTGRSAIRPWPTSAR